MPSPNAFGKSANQATDSLAGSLSKLAELQDNTCSETEDRLITETVKETFEESLKSSTLPNPVCASVDRMLRRLRRATRRHVSDLLHLWLGAIVEDDEVVADTGAVFLCVGEDKLRSVASRNLNRPEVQMSIADNGVVPWVARTRRDAFVPDVTIETLYFCDQPRTKSELAIQIEASDGKLLGIVNLEFWDSVSEDRLREIRNSVRQRLADVSLQLLVLKSILEGNDNDIAWHPDIHGWDLHEVLFQMCHRMSQCIDRDVTKTSIWYGDVKKQTAHVFATSGGAFAYRCDRALSLKSVLGQHLLNPPEHAVEYIPETLRNGRRSNRGVRSFLCSRKILSDDVTCCESNSIAIVVTLGEVEEECRLAEVSNCWNVENALPYVADVVARGLGRFKKLREDIVTTRLYYELAANGLQQFELVLRTALMSLSSSAGSVFSFDREKRELGFVATTGLRPRHNGPDADYSFVYNVDTDDSLTVYTALRDEPIRVNDTQLAIEMEMEQVQTRKSSKFREKTLFDDVEPRRFLGASARFEGEPLLVIRLIRSVKEKRFTQCDADLLAAIARVGSIVVKRFRNQEIELSREDVFDTVCSTRRR